MVLLCNTATKEKNVEKMNLFSLFFFFNTSSTSKRNKSAFYFYLFKIIVLFQQQEKIYIFRFSVQYRGWYKHFIFRQIFSFIFSFFSFCVLQMSGVVSVLPNRHFDVGTSKRRDALMSFLSETAFF